MVIQLGFVSAGTLVLVFFFCQRRTRGLLFPHLQDFIVVWVIYFFSLCAKSFLSFAISSYRRFDDLLVIA